MYAMRKATWLHRIRSSKHVCGCKLSTGDSRRTPRGAERSTTKAEVNEVDTSTVDPVKKWAYLFERKVSDDQEKVFTTAFGHIRIDSDNTPNYLEENLGEKEWAIRNKAMGIIENPQTEIKSKPVGMVLERDIDHIETSAKSNFHAKSLTYKGNDTENPKPDSIETLPEQISRRKNANRIDIDVDVSSGKEDIFDVNIIDCNVAEAKSKEYFEKSIEGIETSVEDVDASSNFFDQQYFERRDNHAGDISLLHSAGNPFGTLFSDDSLKTNKREWRKNCHNIGSELEENLAGASGNGATITDDFVQDIFHRQENDEAQKLHNEDASAVSGVSERNFFDEQYFYTHNTPDISVQDNGSNAPGVIGIQKQVKPIRTPKEFCTSDYSQTEPHGKKLELQEKQNSPISEDLCNRDEVLSLTSYVCRNFIESIKELSDTEFEILLRESQKEQVESAAKASENSQVDGSREPKSLKEPDPPFIKGIRNLDPFEFSTSDVCRKFVESVQELHDTEFEILLRESQEEQVESVAKASENSQVDGPKEPKSLKEPDPPVIKEIRNLDPFEFSTSDVCRKFIESVQGLHDTEFEILLRESQQDDTPTQKYTKRRGFKQSKVPAVEEMNMNEMAPSATVDQPKIYKRETRKERKKKLKRDEMKPENSTFTTGSELVEKVKREQEKEEELQDESTGRKRIKKYRMSFDDMTRSDVLNLLERSVVYRNDDLVAFNKPQGLVFGGNKKQKLLDVKEYVDELAQALDCPTGLHHVTVLDRDTSGVMLFAKSRSLANKLRADFRKGILQKVYWAITRQTSKHKEGIISIPVFEGKIENRSRMALQPDTELAPVYSKYPNRAVTSYKTLGTSKSSALLELRPQTEVRHQIRVHLSFGLGCPILGDHKYSDIKTIRPQKLSSDLMHRLGLSRNELRMLPLYLHCRSVVLTQEDGRNIVISAHPPAIFTKTLRWLRLKKD